MGSIVNVEENWVSEKTGVRNMYSVLPVEYKMWHLMTKTPEFLLWYVRAYMIPMKTEKEKDLSN